MEAILAAVESVVNFGNSLTWGGMHGYWWLGTLIAVLIPVGLYFTVRSRFVQVRSFGHTIHVMKNSRQSNGGVSSFQAFSTSVAARVGTGNIAGVAVAVSLGGPGAVFWMWVVALVGMATSFVENTLGQAFKERGEVEGTFRGGPAYYIEKGMGKKFRWLSVLFSIFLVMSFGFVFNAIQTNSMAGAIQHAWGVDPIMVGIMVTILACVIVFGGIKAIGRFAEVVVPFMAIAYFIVALFVILTHLSAMPAVFELIFSSAFGLQEAGAGVFGAMVAAGVKRGLFSNEAGMGSSPNAGATANVKHPAVQGYVQMLSVFIDTMVICTATASIILLAGLPSEGVAGVTLTQSSLVALSGDWGADFIAMALLFFAFTSVIANYYYAETNVYAIKHSKTAISAYRVLFVVFMMFGAWVATSDANFGLLWAMGDMTMGLMATVNIIALLALAKVAFILLKDYEDQRAMGIEEPVFDARKYNIKGIDASIWNGSAGTESAPEVLPGAAPEAVR
jgi:AGCS family alanine or glycine:cation symporter